LVFDDRQGEGEGSNIDVLIAEVNSGVALNITKQVHRLIEVGNGVRLVAYEVVQTVRAVGVDKAISNPFSCAYAGSCQ
jgi:hypothetical protein